MAEKKVQEVNITSPDLNVERLTELRRLMPDLFNSEGQLDNQALRQLVQPEEADGIERFHFEWAGKQASKRRAFSPSRGTLVADEGRSVNFDETQNLIIEGDNLEALKLLQTTYFEQVKCIYIDPPYNTNNDFIYSDKYTEGKSAYWQKNGTVKDGVKLLALTESNGRKHSAWLNMLQSRLCIARSLLRPDGVIITHIDENEGHRLRFLFDEIFGNDNFLGEIVWDKKNPKGDSGKVSYQHESILLFAKNVVEFKKHNNLVLPKKNSEIMLKKAKFYYSFVGKTRVPLRVSEALKELGLQETKEHEAEYTLDDARQNYQKWLSQQGAAISGGEAMYKYIDEEGRVYRLVSMAWPNNKKAPDEYFIPLKHPVTEKPCPVPAKGWRNPPATMEKLLREGLIVFGQDEKTQPQHKYILEEHMSENLSSLMYYGASDDALLREMKIPFENPKPVEVAKRLMTGVLDKDDIAVDFFAGSGTAGHAIMELNLEHDKYIRFILIQVPEYTDKKHVAYKAGYKTISALCIDRVKKAGEKIKQGHPETSVDTGFRVYRLADSHFPENTFRFDPDLSEKENLSALKKHLDVSSQITLFNEDDLDGIITEISLKNGYGLFFTLEQIEDEFTGNRVYRLSGNGKDALLCLDVELKDETVEFLANHYSEDQLIVSKVSLDTAKTWTLQNAFGDNLRVV